ncbi:MAG: GNAT family N-acetyltransferase [Dermatophilus congolensis]|nr:GNAT family N-acetyltransferase [Dermatophilus congolensis]
MSNEPQEPVSATTPADGGQGAAEQPPVAYPKAWEGDVVLRDGSLAHVRPILPSDGPGIHRFHDGQSEESIYMRFFAPIKHLSESDVHRFTHVDYDERVALVALIGEDIIGIARYDRLDDRSIAEVAFNISDHFQGKGLGSVLLEHLAAIAGEEGVTQFVADVLPQNRKMMKVFVDAGYEVSHAFEDGVIAVSFRIEPTEKSSGVQLAREHRAESQSMSRVLKPASIAVVGVSRRPDAFGTILLDNILDSGFTGPVHVVTSEATSVRGIKAKRKVSDIGEHVDLVVVSVPADAVLDVVEDCAAVKANTLMVVSAGFAEAGPEGEERQAQLLRRARAHGMRVVGPNSFGLVNNDPEVRLNASLARSPSFPGGLGIFTQSGGLGAGLLASVARRGLGVSCFLSAGNRVDVSGNDTMQYLIDDDTTTTVALYLESVGNPRKFSRIARQLSLRKPVVCVKSRTAGIVPPGHRARTTTLPAGAFDALLDQAGVIRAESIHDMVNICELLAQQPLPTGNRIAIVGNASGIVAILTEEARRRGLQIGRVNPVLPLQCTVAEVGSMVEESLDDENVDALVVCLVPPIANSEETMAEAVSHAAWAHNKPVATTFLGMRDTAESMRKAGRLLPDGRRRVVPTYKAPLDSVRSIGAAAGYARWLASDRGERVHPSGIDRSAAAQIIETALAETPEGRELRADEAEALLAAAGIELWKALPVDSPEEAVEAAEQLGYPVVLRSVRPDVRDRPGAGAVRLDIGDATGVEHAYSSLVDAFGPEPQVVVQRLAEHGTPMTLSSVEDPVFGPVITLGLAGASSLLFGDIVHRIPPLTDIDIASMHRQLKSAPLLDGRMGPAVDRLALGKLVGRVSVLADLLPDIARLELNPVNTRPGGVDVLGARITVAEAGARTDAGRRALA